MSGVHVVHGKSSLPTRHGPGGITGVDQQLAGQKDAAFCPRVTWAECRWGGEFMRDRTPTVG